MAKATELIERRTIDPVPESARHGSALNQFTLWFGASMQITAIVDGALAVVFGSGAFWAIIGLFIGNLAGGAVMALHSAQGPKLGLPQMISSRAQFGVYGAVIPLVLVVLMYLGFASTGAVLAGQAVDVIIGVDIVPLGIIIFGVLSAVIAIVGYRWIHIMGRAATIAGIIAFAYLSVALGMTFDVGSVLFTVPFSVATFLTAVGLGAGWQLTFGPYVADYSRYLPSTTPAKVTFGSTFLGTVLGAQWSMTLGALFAALPLSEKDGFLGNQVGFLGRLGAFPGFAILIALVVVIGKLTVNTLNAYGGFMCLVTAVSGFTKTRRIGQGLRITLIVAFLLVTVLIAIFASADFLNYFKNFILLLLMVFTPWSAINLVDYYVVSRERVDRAALYDPNEIYGKWNWRAIITYAVGILIQIPFLAQTLYTGPLAKAMGGADISWILGLVVTGILYWVLMRKHSPSERVAAGKICSEGASVG